MNTNTLFKALTLLCTISLASCSFAAAPAPRKESIEDQLAIIDAMNDKDIMCAVLPFSQEYAEKILAQNKRIFQSQNSACAKELLNREARFYRLSHQSWALAKELHGCGDNARTNHLQAKKREIDSKYAVIQSEYKKYVDFLISGNTMPIDAYNYQVFKLNVFQNHASLLLAQKEKVVRDNIQLQHREVQWQQEKQALVAQLKGYQRLRDGQQIEGVPNVPGGPKAERKRRGSS